MTFRLFVSFLLLALILFAGCSERPTQPFRVGAITFPGYEPLFVARNSGAFTNASIQLVEFPSTPEVLRAFQNQSIEAAALTLDEALSLQETRPDIRAILVLDISKGADALMARPEFLQVNALRGRRVGVEVNALGSYMLSRALASAGMTAADVIPVPVPIYRHTEAFELHEVDAIITFEPHKSVLKKMGARTLFDSSQIPGEIVDLLVVSGAVAKEQPRQLDALMAGWRMATQMLRTNRSGYAAKAAAREGIDSKAFGEDLDGLSFPTIQENRLFLDEKRSPLTQTAITMSRTMASMGLLKAAVTNLHFLDPGPVSRAQP